MDAESWNDRYTAQELLWGAEPNRSLAAEIGATPHPGARALDVGCGEGRNAVWLAALGWTVTAVDFSRVALDHAGRLAVKAGVEITWVQADVTSWVPPEGMFELVLLAYLHLPPEGRRTVLRHAAGALMTGGTLFIIGHSKRNLAEGVGGPPDPTLLYDPEEAIADLEGLDADVQRAEIVRRPVGEGNDVRWALDTLVRAQSKAP